MNIGIVITPGGQLRVADAPESLPDVGDAAAAALQNAFSRSNAEGLLLLASQQVQKELPASLAFWRGFAREFFQAACHLGEEAFDRWGTIPEPAAEAICPIWSLMRRRPSAWNI